MKLINKKAWKVVSTLAVVTALAGCGGGGGSNAGLALAALGGGGYEATVVIGGKFQRTSGAYTTAGCVNMFPSDNFTKPMVVKLTNPADGSSTILTSGGQDFTVACAGAGNADAADFNITFKTNAATGTLHGEIFARPDSLTCGGAPDPCDDANNYSELIGSFDMDLAIDLASPTSLSQFTLNNELGIVDGNVTGASGTALFVKLVTAITTVKGVYSNPLATVGETLCDSIGNPEIITGTISASRSFGKYTLLRGSVVVNNNAVITVPKGSVIYGERGSSLFFDGASLVTQGTAAEPVCFTSAQARGSRFPGDWGGIVFIGNGNGSRTSGTTEGTTPKVYPGTNASNITLRYTIVEFAGNEVAPGDELNSLSHYQVNTATYRFVQAHRGLDDSYEWWGGGLSPSSFDGAYLIGSGGMDDDFDMDEGFSGTLKYLISVKYPASCGGSASTDPHGFEMDGVHASSGFASCPGGVHDCSNPTVSNYTAIGANIANSFGERHREGLQGTFSEGILWAFTQNVHCDTTAGYPAVNSSITNVHSEQAKADSIAGGATCGSSLDDLTALPITDLGSIQDGFCGHNTKPDFTTPASISSGATGGAPVGGSTDGIVGAVGEKWWSGWAVWRAH